MEKYFEAIEKAKTSRGLFETFGYADNKSSDEIKKSHIEDLFESQDAQDRGFTIDRTGAEIKPRLMKMLADEQAVCTMLQTKWATLLEQFEQKPSEPAIKARYYLVDGWEDKLGDLPAYFAWDEIYPTDAESSIGASCDAIAESGEDCICKKKREYNEIVDKYIGCKREIALLETMLANFIDEKVYRLTVKEATLLGW